MSALTTEIRKELSDIKNALLGGDVNGWVCETVFTQRTDLKTKKQLYDFRKENPRLVRQKGYKFIYNLPGYFNLFQ